jgi:hypothetical protein
MEEAAKTTYQYGDSSRKKTTGCGGSNETEEEESTEDENKCENSYRNAEREYKKNHGFKNPRSEKHH